MGFKKVVLTLYVLSIGTLLCAQLNYTENQKKWVDSVFHTLTLDQKIGQLFMVRAYSKKNKKETQAILELIKKHQIGGLCFFQGNPEEQVRVTNLYQQKSNIPLLIAIDAEWGLGMRFPNDALSFPRQLALGAIQDQNTIYEMGREIARHCKRMGIHMNFAPVVDVNNNINNPVINDRSFGENKYNVISQAYAYQKGLHDEGVIACLKHFPGHGDTDVDSHYDLPVINHNIDRLYNIELFPFKNLINRGTESVMVAHLHIPALDQRPNRPTTLSRNAVNDLLRDTLDFNGLIVTDALDMKGVAKYFKNGEAEAEALFAGNDILLLSENVELGISKIKEYISNGTISNDQIDQSVLRILKAKAQTILNQPKILDETEVSRYLNRNEAISIKTDLIQSSLTLLNNHHNKVPIVDVNRKYATLAFGTSTITPFQRRLDSYISPHHYFQKDNFSPHKRKTLLRRLNKYDKVIVSFHDMSKYASKKFGINDEHLSFLESIPSEKLIIVIFGSPYSLKRFGNQTILVAYHDDELTQDITAQSLLGVNSIKGKLPISASDLYKIGDGVYAASIGRLGYCPPEKVGMNTQKLDEIEGIVNEMIDSRAAPGCQVLVAKDGNIVYEKAFGKFEYNNYEKVSTNSLYDLASLTKILATTISIMKLDSEKNINIDLPISVYLPEADTSNKANLTVRSMLAHHARLRPWIPFYSSTMNDKKKNPKPLKEYYSEYLTQNFSIPVAQRLFMRSDYRDTIWKEILASELLDNNNEYRYSDLGFYMMKKIVENKSGISFQRFVDSRFYIPMGLKYLGFNPLFRFPITDIAPSEHDMYFRNQIIRGTVHDMGAAMLGGVSGHAGLFGNARDVAIIMQMLLNNGYYGGQQYIDKDIVKKYTSKYFLSTRRGLGFDMKETDTLKTINMCELASPQTFGHLGFTGTVTFADPKHNLIYVFLSNRTFPSMENKKFNKLDIRPRIQCKIYESLGIAKEGA